MTTGSDFGGTLDYRGEAEGVFKNAKRQEVVDVAEAKISAKPDYTGLSPQAAAVLRGAVERERAVGERQMAGVKQADAMNDIEEKRFAERQAIMGNKSFSPEVKQMALKELNERVYAPPQQGTQQAVGIDELNTPGGYDPQLQQSANRPSLPGIAKERAAFKNAQGNVTDTIEGYQGITQEQQAAFDNSVNERKAIEENIAQANIVNERARQELADSQKTVMAEVQASADRANERAKYFNASEEVFESAYGVLSDPKSTDKQRIAARLSLSGTDEQDPYRFLQGAVPKTLAILSAAFGGISKAYGGTSGYDMIEKAIDRDIQAQLNSAQTKRQAARDARGRIDDRRTSDQHEIAQQELQANANLRPYFDALGKITNGLKDSETKAKLQTKLQNEMLAVDKREEAITGQEFKSKMAQRAAMIKASAKASAENQYTFGNGRFTAGPKFNKKDAPKVAALANSVTGAEDLISAFKESATNNYWGEKSRDAASHYVDVMMMLKADFKLGVMSASDEKLLRAAASAPVGFYADENLRRLVTRLQSKIGKDVAMMQDGYGVELGGRRIQRSDTSNERVAR